TRTCCWPSPRENAAGVAPVAVKANVPGCAAGRVRLTIVSEPTTSTGTSIPALALHLEGEPASTHAAAGGVEGLLAFCCQVTTEGTLSLPSWSGTQGRLTTPRSTVAGADAFVRSPHALPSRSARGGGEVGTANTAQSALPPWETGISGGL